MNPSLKVEKVAKKTGCHFNMHIRVDKDTKEITDVLEGCCKELRKDLEKGAIIIDLDSYLGSQVYFLFIIKLDMYVRYCPYCKAYIEYTIEEI